MRFYLRNDISGGRGGWEAIGHRRVIQGGLCYNNPWSGWRRFFYESKMKNSRLNFNRIWNFCSKIERKTFLKRCIKFTAAFFFRFEEKYIFQIVWNVQSYVRKKIIKLFPCFHCPRATHDELRATLYTRPPRWISIRITATVGRWDLGLFLQPSPSPAFPAWVNNSQRHEENVAPLW